MVRSSSLEYKELVDLVPGELIRYNFSSGASLLLLLKLQENGRGLFGVIDSSVFEKKMCSYSMDLDGGCLSYGVNWFLEEHHGPETAVGYYQLQHAGLYLTSKGPLFRFMPEKSRFAVQHTYFNLMESTVVDGVDQRQAAPIAEWSIWETAEHYVGGGDPIFEMEPSDPAMTK